MLLICHMTHW